MYSNTYHHVVIDLAMATCVFLYFLMSKALPRLLDVMPFLHRSQDKAFNSSMWPELQLPMDNSIKAGSKSSLKASLGGRLGPETSISPAFLVGGALLAPLQPLPDPRVPGRAQPAGEREAGAQADVALVHDLLAAAPGGLTARHAGGVRGAEADLLHLLPGTRKRSDFGTWRLCGSGLGRGIGMLWVENRWDFHTGMV